MNVEPVRKSIVVEAPQAHAFRVFTDGIDRWWPRQHNVGPSPMARAVLEPQQGGRWYTICEDGTQCEIGRVLVWDPPRRLVLAWQLTTQWTYDQAFVTEVEVTFTALAEGRTQVDLEHRDLERYGDAAPGMRKAIDGADGWPLVLELFAGSAAA